MISRNMKQEESKEEPSPATFRISQKVNLVEGDKVKVSAGPYYMSKSGQKISMGHKGKGEFFKAFNETSLSIRIGGQMEIVYVGPEYTSPETQTVMRPHKITKLRS